MIPYPFENGFCEKCNYSYHICREELRCAKIKVGMSDCMCARVAKCCEYKEKSKCLTKSL